MKKILFSTIAIISWLKLTAGDDFCGITNKAFKPGELITYNVFYAVAGIYVNAGTATFSLTEEKVNNIPAYHVVGEGRTNSGYDWIFKVRDRYESYFDAGTMQPVRSIRSVNEGKYKKYEEVVFDAKNNTATNKKGVHKVPQNIQDVISAVYCARNLDYTGYKVGDKIPFNMFFGSEVYNIYIRYAGKETVKTKYGNVRTIILKPLLLKGDTFKGGEGMTVWVTDDNNHVPVKIESKLSVGSIKVDLVNYQNLKYPLVVAQN